MAGEPLEYLEEAIELHGVPDIFNSDQGAQFTSNAFIAVLLINGVSINAGRLKLLRSLSFMNTSQSLRKIILSLPYTPYFARPVTSAGITVKSSSVITAFTAGDKSFSIFINSSA